MPPEKYNPFYKKMKEIQKRKALKWAKKHGCYGEVKKIYEIKEWMEKQIVYWWLNKTLIIIDKSII